MWIGDVQRAANNHRPRRRLLLFKQRTCRCGEPLPCRRRLALLQVVTDVNQRDRQSRRTI